MDSQVYMCYNISKTQDLSLLCQHYILGTVWFFHLHRVFRKALVDILRTLSIQEGKPLSKGCALDNISTDLSSHVPCIYRETPWNPETNQVNHLTILLSQCTENTTQGDFPHVLKGSRVVQPRVQSILLGWSSKILGQVLLLDPTVYGGL